jgi:capsular polysaccharide biosynthesis protein
MNKSITVSLPINATEDVMRFFKPFLSYDLQPQKVKIFRNVFVTYSGFCLNHEGLIKECHHDHPHQLNDYKNEAAHYYYNVTDNPENLLTFDDDNFYLLIHHPWFNYYHWLMECVFRAWMVRDKKDKMILLLPDSYEKVDFITGSLEPFNFERIFYIPMDKSLMIRNLCMPQIKAKVDSYDYKMVNDVREFYLNYVSNVKKIIIDYGDKIYISRKKAQRKKVENEAALERILLKHNFKVIDNEDFTFLEQVAVYSNAKYLISIHGSGLTNMLFMKGGSSILELHKSQTNDKDWHSKAFWYMAEALGFNYYQQICEPTDINDDYFNANFIVDEQIFERNIALMIKS